MDEDDAFDYGLDWTEYDYGDSGYVEPFNYEPEGSQNPAWDTPEHFAYEPPTGDNSSEVVSPGGGNYVEGISGNIDPYPDSNYNQLGQWGDKDSLRSNLRGSGSGNSPLNRGTYRVTGSSGSDTTTTTGSSTTRRIPTKNLPIFNGPSLYIPEWDNEKIKRLRQSKANSGISSLRNLTNRAITFSRSSQSGYGARQSLRESLAGYGTGLSKIMKEADTEAQTEYGREYIAGANKAQNEYNAKFQVANIMYQAALQDYLNSFTTETTTDQTANTQRSTFNNFGYFSA